MCVGGSNYDTSEAICGPRPTISVSFVLQNGNVMCRPTYFCYFDNSIRIIPIHLWSSTIITSVYVIYHQNIISNMILI